MTWCALGLLLVLAPTRAVAAQARIVNGIDTHDHPTTGALLDASSPNLSAICTGTLIGCHTFVVAAHCVCLNGAFASCGTPNAAKFRVYLQHGGIHDVAAVAVNPAFEFGGMSDVAVLTLATSVDGVVPTPINTVGTPPLGTPGVIVGFGGTNGFAADAGLKREGMVHTASCAGTVPEPAHVCWAFENPLGAPGTNSNTCAGDSGGPLFADLGAGLVLAGVTSGGDRASCLPADLSFDTNVYENRAFIESIGGADLTALECGAMSQVGDADTAVKALTSTGLDKAARQCRATVAKQYLRYALAGVSIRQRCINKANRRSGRGPCPDPATIAKLAKAAARVDSRAMTKRCGPAVVPASLPDGGCAGAQNVNDLQACIVDTADDVIAALLDGHYANAAPDGPIADRVLRRCQETIARAMGAYARGRLRTLVACQRSEDEGKISSCPSGRVAERLAKLVAQVEPVIARKCTAAHIAALQIDAFGGSCGAAATPGELAACQIADHDAAIEELTGLLTALGGAGGPRVDVPEGTALLRVALNAIDVGGDLDLYLRHGAPPTRASFDRRSTNGGVFEAIEVLNPAAGSWFFMVDRVRGGALRFQLTATTFQP